MQEGHVFALWLAGHVFRVLFRLTPLIIVIAVFLYFRGDIMFLLNQTRGMLGELLKGR